MARPVWTGSISFGLVNVPVKAYTAVRDHDVHFHEVDEPRFARSPPQGVGEVGPRGRERRREDGLRGVEGPLRHVRQGGAEGASPALDSAIEVTEFVLLEEIDPIYYERTYWLGPDGDAGKKAYGLLLAAMEERRAGGDRHGRHAQQAVLDGGSSARWRTRHVHDAVRRRGRAPKCVDGVPNRASKPEAAALKMAMQLVDGLAADWDPAKYRDTYVEELRKRIKAKQAGKELVEETAAAESDGKVLDLMAALEASVQASKAKTGRAAPRKAGAHKAGARKTKKSA